MAALRESLLTLGYRHSYHTIDAITFSYYDCKLWDDLLKRKEAGEKVTREDFDQILGHCQVSCFSSQAAQSGSGGFTLLTRQFYGRPFWMYRRRILPRSLSKRILMPRSYSLYERRKAGLRKLSFHLNTVSTRHITHKYWDIRF